MLTFFLYENCNFWQNRRQSCTNDRFSDNHQLYMYKPFLLYGKQNNFQKENINICWALSSYTIQLYNSSLWVTHGRAFDKILMVVYILLLYITRIPVHALRDAGESTGTHIYTLFALLFSLSIWPCMGSAACWCWRGPWFAFVNTACAHRSVFFERPRDTEREWCWLNLRSRTHIYTLAYNTLVDWFSIATASIWISKGASCPHTRHARKASTHLIMRSERAKVLYIEKGT